MQEAGGKHEYTQKEISVLVDDAMDSWAVIEKLGQGPIYEFHFKRFSYLKNEIISWLDRHPTEENIKIEE